ncbi:MAG: MG2 domain-containing protein [bacterium]
MKPKFLLILLLFPFLFLGVDGSSSDFSTLTDSDIDLEITDQGLLVSVNFASEKAQTPRIGDLSVTLLDEKFEPVETTSKQVVMLDKEQRETVFFPTKIEPNALPLYSVDVEFGGKKLHKRVTRPIERQDIILLGQDHLEAGSQASVRIVVRNTGKNEPVKDAVITGRLTNKETNKEYDLFETKTNSRGSADIAFSVPEDLQGQQELVVEVESESGKEAIRKNVTVVAKNRIYLTSDKPVYQPGQLMHLRALALRASDWKPVPNSPITLEIADGKGNKVFKKALETSEYGVVSAEFQLADEVNEGAYTLSATLADQEAEKVVTVKQYVLPKFKIEVNTDRDYYGPGEKITGKLECAYFFGKPISDGPVKMTASCFDVGFNEFDKFEGKTDSEGVCAFELTVPEKLVAQDSFKGAAMVQLQVKVRDGADHEEEKYHIVHVAQHPIQLDVIPESGQVVAGVENTFYLLASYPDGSAATPELSVALSYNVSGKPGKEIKTRTDDKGLATVTFDVAKETSRVILDIAAKDTQGNKADVRRELEIEETDHPMLVRTDKGTYQVGDTMLVEIICPDITRETVFVDIIKDDQTVLTQSVDLQDGKGTVPISLDQHLFGTLALHAYRVLANGEMAGDTRKVVVNRRDDLQIAMKPDKEEYRPGDPAEVAVTVTDSNGKGTSAALGIDVVDESVFALAEKQPGLAKVFFTIEKELLDPKYEIHGFTFEELVRHSAKDRDWLEKAAKVSLAKDDTQPGYSLREFTGASLLNEAHARVVQLARGLAQIDRKSRPEGPVESVLYPRIKLADARMVVDPWGEAYRIWQKEEEQIVQSAGPDHQFGTSDDIEEVIRPLIQRGFRGGGMRGREIARRRFGVGKQPMAAGRPVGGGEFFLADNVEAVPEVAAPQEVQLQALGYVNGGMAGMGKEARDKKVEFINGFDGSRDIEAVDVAGLSALRVAGKPVDEGGVDKGVNVFFELPELRAGDEAEFFRTESKLDTTLGFGFNVDEADVLAYKDAPDGKAPVQPAPPRERPKDIRVRSYFPELLFTNPSLVTDENGHGLMTFAMADSITTWRMTALANSKAGKLGSGEGSLRSFQEFFIDLDLPIALTQEDEVTIPVAIHNYLPKAQTVQVELKQEPWFELIKDETKKSAEIPANDVGKVDYRIRAKKLGKNTITVYGWSNEKEDAVARIVEVRPNGEEQFITINGRLTDEVSHTLDFPAEAMAGASKILLRVYPGIFSQVVEGLDSIMRMPHGCFEQTSSITYPNILVLDYMKRTEQVTPEIEMKAREYINLGYQRLLTFEIDGGGFEVFGNPPANRVLSAYGLLEFTDMNHVYPIDERIIQRTQQWLASEQRADGSWEADKNYSHSEMWKSIQDNPPLVTAFITWALGESGYRGEALDKARGYLKTEAEKAKDSYTMAMMANAFAAENPDDPALAGLLERLKAQAVETRDTIKWPSEVSLSFAHGEVATIETTSLVAIAMIKSGKYPKEVGKALNYLIQQKDPNGTWHSTHATVLALKTMVCSLGNATEEMTGTATIMVDGEPAAKIEITPETCDVVRLVNLGTIAEPGKHDVQLSLKGDGSVLYQIVGSYFTPWRDGKKLEPLAISVDYDRTELERNETVTCKVTATNNTPRRAEMVILDVGIPPGFRAETPDLDDAVKAEKIAKYTVTGRQVTIYLRYLNTDEPFTIEFPMKARLVIAAKSPESKIYEYYNPEVNGFDQTEELKVR